LRKDNFTTGISCGINIEIARGLKEELNVFNTPKRSSEI
jgi:hypothetical protein